MIVRPHGADALGLAAPEPAHHDPVHRAPLGAAAAPVVVTPSSGKAPDAANAGGPVQKKTQRLIFTQRTGDDKRFATLRAHLALKGYSLHRTAAGDGLVRFYVTRWGMARELRDLAVVARFLDQVGDGHA